METANEEATTACFEDEPTDRWPSRVVIGDNAPAAPAPQPTRWTLFAILLLLAGAAVLFVIERTL